MAGDLGFVGVVESADVFLAPEVSDSAWAAGPGCAYRGGDFVEVEQADGEGAILHGLGEDEGLL